MLYTLTQEELDNLVPKKEPDAVNAGLEWMRNRFVPKCPHNLANDGRRSGEVYYYCSECPLSDIAHGEMVKDAPPSDISSAICPNKRRRYDK